MCNWFSIPGSQSRGRVSHWGSSSLIYQAQPVLPTTSGGRLQEVTASQGAHAQIEAPIATPNTDDLDEVDSPPKELPGGGTIGAGNADTILGLRTNDSIVPRCSNKDEGMF
jgi:hypothetical protein